MQPQPALSFPDDGQARPAEATRAVTSASITPACSLRRRRLGYDMALSRGLS